MGVRQQREQQGEHKPQKVMPAAPAAASTRDPSPVPPPTLTPPRKGPGSRDSSPGSSLGSGSKANDGPVSPMLPAATMEGGEVLTMITE